MSQRIVEIFEQAHSYLNKLEVTNAQVEINRLINESENTEDLSILIYGKILLARSEWAQNNLFHGLHILKDVEKELRNVKFHDDYNFLLANAYETKALIKNYQSNYKSAFKLWFKLLELTPELENPENFLLNAYIGIGDVYQLSGKLEDAEKSFRYAFEYSKSTGDPHLVVKCGLYLASIYSKLQKPRQLSQQLNTISDYFEDDYKIDQAWQIDYAIYNGIVLQQEGKIHKALTLVSHQIERSIKYEYYWGLWKASELKANLLCGQREFQEAVVLMSRTIERITSNMAIVPSDAFLLVSNLYKEIKDFANALHYIKQYRKRKIEELSNARKNMILFTGIKARYFNLLLENHFLRWQSESWKGGSRAI